MEKSPHPATSRVPAWFNATALLSVSWVSVAIMTLQVRPGADAVAVAFPPWWSATRTVLASSAADADIVRETAMPMVLIVRPSSHDGIARLHQMGAWLIFDPQAIAACLKVDLKRI